MSHPIAHDIENKVRTDDVNIVDNVDFTAMLLSDKVLQGLLTNGFKKPSPIQLKAIPMGRCGYDLIIQAKSGTGKTAVFGVIALEMIDVSQDQIQVLILAPTREIAVQIQEVIKSIGVNFEGLRLEYFIGGTPIKEDVSKLKNCHIAVGAPGRIKHLIKDGHMKVDAVRLFVLDEADKLLTCSQHKDINFIYNKLKHTKQMIASSATYPGDLKNTITNYMQTPAIITPNQDVPVLLGIRQFVTTVESHLNIVQQMALKTDEMIRIFRTVSFSQCMVFCNYQNRAETLNNNLNRQGWPSNFISGAQNQKSRLETINCLKEFKCRILTSTDLTARGIDASNVDLVINFEVPVDCETYLHRMGRAGRYGSNGLCVTIATEGAEIEKLQGMISKIGSKLVKFPKNVPADIWTCDLEQFEKLETVCNTLKELSVQETEITENTETQIDVNAILNSLNKEDEASKIEIKNKFADLDPSSIINFLAQNKLENTDFEVKKVKHNKYNTNEDNIEENNEQFETEAKLFQKNKNIALYNITKIIVQESITEENIHSTEKLLQIIEQEDNLEIKEQKSKAQFDDILNKLGLKTETTEESILGDWQIVDNSPNITGNECTCPENLFCVAFDYATSKVDEDWRNLICDYHKNITNTEESCAEEEEYCEEEEEYCEEEEFYDAQDYDEENEVVFDDDLFIQAYDYALNSEVTNETETKDLNETEPCGYGASYCYDHLKTRKRKRLRIKNKNKTEDDESKYESYFDYYNELLAQYGPYFTDLSEFENWFQQWQDNVINTRNQVQEEIYAKEKSKNCNS